MILGLRCRQLCIFAGLGLAALILLGYVLYVRANPDVNDILARGLIPAIPESAQDVRISEDRDSYRVAVFVTFRATSEVIDGFVSATGGMLPDGPSALRNSRFNPQAYPAWWLPDPNAEGRVYFTGGKGYAGAIITVEDTNIVHVTLDWYRPKWWVRMNTYLH